MYLMIDNYDSFVYNLCTYMSELGREVRVVRNDKITLDEIEDLLLKDRLSGIMISPGPKTPEDCGICCLAVKQFAGRVPILGICLGHQIIGHVYGGTIKKGRCPMHGKISFMHNRGTGLFSELPETYRVTRYHSLVVSEEAFPEMLQIDAKSEDGVIMAMSHRTEPVFGVQFHPEAVLTQYGHELLQNYIGICEEWKQGRRYPYADYSEKTAAI